MAESLTEMFWDYVKTCVSNGGFSVHQGMIMGADGKITFLAMALDPEQAYQAMLTKVAVDRAPSAIFALDRFTKEGQGTKYADLLAGHWFTDGAWRPFIIEYQVDPPIVEPINFQHAFWNAALTREFAANLARLTERVAARLRESARG